MTEGGERIAKVIARAGLCSRREAERLIAEGRVTLDGRVLDSPAVTVAPGAKIAVDGVALPAAPPTRLWRYHKPAGVLTAARDPRGRPTLYDRLPEGLPRVMPVGRLDLTSEGLLLLTNDGALKRRLELPATGWARRYRVRVYGRVEEKALAALAHGVPVEGLDYGPIAARLDSQSGANAWLTMSLAEGKNREVRRVCEHLGLKVSRLIRLAYGPFQLGRLPPGGLEEVPARVLAEQLGQGAAGAAEREARGRKTGRGWAKAKPRKQSPGKARRAHRRRTA
ncbi:MAG: rRNA pseudouridine synthase [Rhodospirillales bacterium]|nr:rRNA pseudouridine synthase [Rhodospirillales bacterium]